MMRTLNKLLTPINRRLRLMVSRAVIGLVNDSLKTQRLQLTILDGEVQDDVERFQEYGYTSVPHPGCQVVMVSIGGSRSHGIVVASQDGRYRLSGMTEGEVAVHDDLGQKVHLTRAGIVIDGAGLPVSIQNSPHVTATTDKFTVTGDFEVGGKADVTGNITTLADVAAVNVAASSGVSSASGALTMADIKTKFNAHVHSDPQGGTVSAPSVTM